MDLHRRYFNCYDVINERAVGVVSREVPKSSTAKDAAPLVKIPFLESNYISIFRDSGGTTGKAASTRGNLQIYLGRFFVVNRETGMEKEGGGVVLAGCLDSRNIFP